MLAPPSRKPRRSSTALGAEHRDTKAVDQALTELRQGRTERIVPRAGEKSFKEIVPGPGEKSLSRP